MAAVSILTFGQAETIIHETFGSGGFWEGPMNTNPNLTSAAIFSDDKARTQGWNASSGYDAASGGFHVILTSSASTDTVRFKLNSNHFSDVTFSLGAFSWGAAKGQFDFEYSTDGENWTLFDEDAITTGDLSGGGWTFVTFSEDLPEADELSIKIYRTADQVHLDDIIVTGVPKTTNAFLKSVSLDAGEIDFAYHTNTYEVWVPYGTTETPTITAEAFDADATVSITDAADITSATEADRTSTVEVTAEDGTTTNTYEIVFNVTPPREDATLSDIQLEYATLAPAFNSMRMRYLVDLPDTATVQPEITPVLSDADGATFTQTEAADITAADEADRTASIEVTAQDGVTTMTYEVVFKVGGGSDDLFVIDAETFGDEGNKFNIVLSEYPGFTSQWIWGDMTAHIRTSNPSTGYENASGANRVEMQAGWGQEGNDTIVFQANTSAFSNVTLATGVYNNSGHDSGAEWAFQAYYSTDSVNWTSIGAETQLGTAFPVASEWSYVILDDVLPTDDTLYFLFANEDDDFEYYLDDITLWGTPLNTNNQLAGIDLSEGTLDPAFDPNVTEYTVELPQGTSETPTVTPAVLSPSATIDQVDAPDVRSLNEEDKTTTVTVTAENGSVKTYEIYFDVFMSSDATLKELSVGDLPLSPNFSNDIAGYGVKLPAGTTEAPEITATPESDFATVTVTGPADINSADVADRTATIEVMAENMVNTKTFEIVFTFGSLSDVRFYFLQEKFDGTAGSTEAEDYTGYTSGAMFDGDAHKWDNRGSSTYPLASGGAAIKFGDWAGSPTFTELVMKAKVEGYNDLRLAFGIRHESGGWGDNGCGLTNNFILVEYTTDSATWSAMNMDSLTNRSMDWPCGGADFSFVELGEEIPVDDQGYVTVRITHTDGTIHPFHVDDITLSGSPISTDASLFDLTISEGTLDPLFDPDVHDYTAELPIGTTETPSVTATAAEDSADVVVADAADVTSAEEADRTTTITVTAPDGTTTETYSIVFTVLKNNDATLTSLSVDGETLDPAFDPVTFDYEVELEMGTTETPAVTADPTDPNATVDITDAADVTSEDEADRTTTIVVTAEDGTTALTYTVVFTGAIVGVNDMEAGAFSIYPNPAENRLFISNGDQVESVTVTNLAGQVMQVERMNQGDRVGLDISNLDAGFYLLKITDRDGASLTTRFIRQ